LWTAICPISGSGLSPDLCWPFCLSSLYLLKVPVEISSLPLLPLPACLHHPALSAACSFAVPGLLFSFSLWGGVSVCPWGYAGLPQGWLWEYHVLLVAHLLVCWMSPKQVWSLCLLVWEPSCFLSVTWCGEALYGLGVQGFKVLIHLGAFYLPSVASVSQQDF
jgi:hypothetical protein